MDIRRLPSLDARGAKAGEKAVAVERRIVTSNEDFILAKPASPAKKGELEWPTTQSVLIPLTNTPNDLDEGSPLPQKIQLFNLPNF